MLKMSFIVLVLQKVFSNVGGRKSSDDSQSKDSLRKETRKRKREKNEQVRDEENYISYRPADYSTEQGYV